MPLEKLVDFLEIFFKEGGVDFMVDYFFFFWGGGDFPLPGIPLSIGKILPLIFGIIIL